jgi:uncharacterized protein
VNKKPYNKKYNDLLTFLKQYKSAAVAFSGGTDSTFLLKASSEALGSNVLAITAKTPYIPDWEIAEADGFCKEHKIKHKIISLPFPESIRNNPDNRCYLCKNILFGIILKEAQKEGIEYVFDGTNSDDLSDYRPGIRALHELGVVSPLLECGFSKNNIREHAKSMGLKVWDKPAYACLLTRLPYNQPIKDPDFKRIEKAEQFIEKSGFRPVRVRVQGNEARLEMSKDLFARFINENFYETTVKYLKSLGFNFVSLDLEGYRKGSFNLTIKK